MTRSRALPAARVMACCDAKDGLLQDCSQRLGSQLLTPQCGKGCDDRRMAERPSFQAAVRPDGKMTI